MQTPERLPDPNDLRTTLLQGASVLLALGALAAGAGMGVMTAKADGALQRARSEAQDLAEIVEAYQLLGGDRCPSVVTLEQSRLLRRGARAQDPWGTRYEVVCETAAVNVRSSGPDRVRGTSDDIALY